MVIKLDIRRPLYQYKGRYEANAHSVHGVKKIRLAVTNIVYHKQLQFAPLLYLFTQVFNAKSEKIPILY